MKAARGIRSKSSGAERFVDAPGSASLRAPRSAEEIASSDNRWLKRFRAGLAGAEKPDGAIALEGPHLVGAALSAGLRVEAILISTTGERHLKAIQPPLLADTLVLRTSDRLFASVAATETPQGIAALVHPRNWAFENLAGGGEPLIVVLAACKTRATWAQSFARRKGLARPAWPHAQRKASARPIPLGRKRFARPPAPRCACRCCVAYKARSCCCSFAWQASGFMPRVPRRRTRARRRPSRKTPFLR